MSLADLAGFARLTLRQPDRAVAVLRGLNLPMADRWAALLLVAVLFALIGSLPFVLLPMPADLSPAERAIHDLMQTPFLLVALQFGGVVLWATVITLAGRAFGGTGQFPDVLLALTWALAIILAAETLQLLVVLLLPGAATVLSLALIGLIVYLLVRVTGAVHGFVNPFLVALGMAATVILLSTALSFILTLTGLGPSLPVEGLAP